jgi:hypothetical protein
VFLVSYLSEIRGRIYCGYDSGGKTLTRFGKVSFGSPVPVYCKKCNQKITDLEKLVTPTDFRKNYPSCPHCNREINEYDVFYLVGETRL